MQEQKKVSILLCLAFVVLRPNPYFRIGVGSAEKRGDGNETVLAAVEIDESRLGKEKMVA